MARTKFNDNVFYFESGWNAPIFQRKQKLLRYLFIFSSTDFEWLFVDFVRLLFGTITINLPAKHSTKQNALKFQLSTKILPPHESKSTTGPKPATNWLPSNTIENNVKIMNLFIFTQKN